MSIKKVSAAMKTEKYMTGFIKVHGEIPHCSTA